MTSVAASLPVAERVRTPWSEFWRKFKRQHVAVVAGIFVLLLVAVAVLAPWIVPYDAENYFDYDSAKRASLGDALVRRRSAGSRHFQSGV